MLENILFPATYSVFLSTTHTPPRMRRSASTLASGVLEIHIACYSSSGQLALPSGCHFPKLEHALLTLKFTVVGLASLLRPSAVGNHGLLSYN